MKTLEEVVEEVKKEREEQMKKWPPGPGRDYAHRPYEEWLLLMEQYLSEARAEYAHKPGNAPSREKLLRAVNLGLWGLQCEAKTD
jgi:hypothetical protein